MKKSLDSARKNDASPLESLTLREYVLLKRGFIPDVELLAPELDLSSLSRHLWRRTDGSGGAPPSAAPRGPSGKKRGVG